jgi:hypothetical protein
MPDRAAAIGPTVCLTIPEGRFDLALEPKLGGLLVAAAADISADLRDAGFIRDARPPASAASPQLVKSRPRSSARAEWVRAPTAR